MNKLFFIAIAFQCLFTLDSANAQWVQNVAVNTPICKATRTQSEPKIIPDGVGGSYIVWKDNRNFNTPDAFLQRVNKDGLSLWIVDGLNVCVNPEDQSTPTLCSDGENGVIAAWSDFRNGTDRNIYAQRIDSNGFIQWSFNGTIVTNKTIREYNEKIISDGNGGAIILWEQGGSGIYDIWAQRIDADGVPMWASGGIALSTATSNKLNAVMTMGADNNIYFAWQDQRSGNTDIYAQKLDLNGNRLWGNAAKSVIVDPERQDEPRIALTQNGLGIYVTWVDRRNGLLNTDIYAQKLDSSGTKKWVSTAISICANVSIQNQVALTSSGIKNGFVATWRDYRSGGTSDIYAQKLDSNGVIVYALNGIAIATEPGDQLNPVIINDTNGGAIIAWQDKNSGNSNIRAQKLNTAGTSQWGVYADVCTAAGEQSAPKIIPDLEDGLIAVWEDARDTSNINIMGQRIRSVGSYVYTSLKDNNMDNISVYPNPFSQTIHVQNVQLNNTKVTMLDMLGRKVDFATLFINNELVITLAKDTPNGIYFLQIIRNETSHTIKIVKQ
jgi:Secretion system C-terminal sorting domain